MVGSLSVVLAIDSASACRFLRSRCRPRCRVVTCRIPVATHETHVTHACLPNQCCLPADGSAHVVVEETAVVDAPAVETPSVGTPVTDSPRPIEAAVPQLEPVAPASAEKPLPAEQPAVPAQAPAMPVREPQFKTAAEILAEKAEQDRLEKEAAAARPATPVPEPQFRTAAEILAESAEKEAVEKAALESMPKPPADAPRARPEETARPMPEKIENLFDEGGDLPAEREPQRPPRQPMKQSGEPRSDAPDNLFDEQEPPSTEKPSSTREPAAGGEDPFSAILVPSAEPVRRWIDDTGRHETIGRLVEIRPDAVRILKDNGRHATVPLARLSRHDLNYVTATGERLAAQEAAAPAVTDTARR